MRCSYCGAPLDLSPDSVVVVCRYCGFVNFVVGDPSEVLAVPTLPSGEVVKKAVERTRRDFNLRFRMSKINFAAPQLVYLPFYFVNVDIIAIYSARVLVTYSRSVYSGGRWTTHTGSRRVDVSGRVGYRDVVGVLARKAAWGLSVDRLLSHFFKTAPAPTALKEVTTSQEIARAFMSSEYTPEQAKAKAVRASMPKILKAVDDDAKSKAMSRVSGVPTNASVLDKTVDYEVRELNVSKLTYLPMWVVPYYFKESVYKYYVAGWDGRVIVAEEPSFIEHKLASAVGAAAAGGAVGGFGLSVLPFDLVVGAFMVGMGGYLSYLAARGLVKPRRVET
ncbi:MAG: zinc ribbon domain-containing protein [Pyrobaculum sp.]